VTHAHVLRARDAVARLLLRDILAMAEKEGILDQLRRRSPVAFPDLCAGLEADLGYALGQGNRRRMLRLLLALLAECGWVEEGADTWRWRGAGDLPAGAAAADPGPPADGQYRFFRRCVASAPAYLRGGQPAVLFDGASAALWGQFLGCEEFCTGRSLLLDVMAVPNEGRIALLDLCHGPGWGVAAVRRQLPAVRITAVDFTQAFAPAARARAARAGLDGGIGAPVQWVGPERWPGFGHPLPFPAGAFHAVFFSCGDPYIPRGRRRQVYAEMARVLAPGGTLGVLTRSCPGVGPRRRSPSWPAVLTLGHDFAESVCAGWEGFTPARDLAEVFAAAGFSGALPAGGMSLLDGSLWVLRKRDA
jgi:SAM-dependent methyltransferase